MDTKTDVSAYLTAETERLNRSTRNVAIGGALLAVAMLGYLGFVNHMISTFAEPQSIASLVGDQARASLPQLLQKTEQAISDKAPELGDMLSARAVAAIGEVGAEGRRQIDAAITDQLPHIGDELSATMRQYLDEHAADIRKFADEHGKDEFAKEFVELLSSDLESEVNRIISEDGHGFTLRDAGEALEHHLAAAEVRLGELLAKPVNKLTEEEKLQRRVLAGLYRRLGKGAPSDSQ